MVASNVPWDLDLLSPLNMRGVVPPVLSTAEEHLVRLSREVEDDWWDVPARHVTGSDVASRLDQLRPYVSGVEDAQQWLRGPAATRVSDWLNEQIYSFEAGYGTEHWLGTAEGREMLDLFEVLAVLIVDVAPTPDLGHLGGIVVHLWLVAVLARYRVPFSLRHEWSKLVHARGLIEDLRSTGSAEELRKLKTYLFATAKVANRRYYGR